MKASLIQLASIGARSYFRWWPSTFGKAWLWHSIVERYIAWRSITTHARTTFGAKVITSFPDSIQARIYFWGVWEPVVTGYIADALAEGDVFIDIGANIGYYSLLASQKVGRRGLVYAIEASPSIYQLLLQNLALNHVGNVVPISAAVADKVRSVPVYRGAAENIGATAIIDTGRGAEVEAHARGAPLGELISIADIGRARLVKIDVEGAEWLVLQGMRPVLAALDPRCELIIEINAEALRSFGASPAEFIGIMRDAGFEPFEIENAYEIALYASRARPAPRPLVNFDFAQKDVVFKRR